MSKREPLFTTPSPLVPRSGLTRYWLALAGLFFIGLFIWGRFRKMGNPELQDAFLSFDPDPLVFFSRNATLLSVAVVALLLFWLLTLPRFFPRARAAVAGVIHAYPALVGLVVIFLLACLFSPFREVYAQGEVVGEERIFTQINNWNNILRQVSENGILAVGMTLVIISAGIDLSVGSLLAVSGTLAALLLVTHGWGLVPVLLLCLLSGVLLGSISGVTIHFGGIQPFIVTLAMMLSARGIALMLTDNQVVPFPFNPGESVEAYLFLAAPILPFDWSPRVPVLIFFAIALIGGIILRYTTLGRHLYAIGSNERSARLSGVPVGRVKWFAYAFSGFTAALAGVIHTAQVRSGQPGDGMAFELYAIAAVVIGGTSLMGGVGTMVGTVCGVLMFGIINNFMGIYQFDSNLQKILIGIIIIAAVLAQRRRAI